MIRQVSRLVKFMTEAKHPVYFLMVLQGVFSKWNVPTWRLKSLLAHIVIEPPFNEDQYLTPWFDSAPLGAFVDVGANKGEWSRRMADRGRKVIAFEPDPKLRKYLKGIKLYPVALGDSDGTVKLNLQMNSGMNSIRFNEDISVGSLEVPLRRLDHYALSGVGLIKIDTEGYEVPVLRGARLTIAANRPRLIVEVHGDFAKEQMAIEEILRSMGYSPKVVHIRLGQPHIVADPS